MDNASPPDSATLTTPRFAADPAFQAIARGAASMARGQRGPAVEKLQRTLVGLGHALPHGVDGAFGGETDAALREAQTTAGLDATGVLDATALRALDAAARAQLDSLADRATPPDERPRRYHLVADLVGCRVYVLARAGDAPVAAYLTSPGRDGFATQGTHFVIQATVVRGWWNPPAAAWAAKLSRVAPGVENPMGLCKLSFGAYGEYLHGIPHAEEAELGHAASHGCLRLSGANVLELHELYAGAGTDLVLSRDGARGAALASAFLAAGVADRPIDAGREYLAPYLYGELGHDETLGPGGAVVAATHAAS